MQEVMKDHKRIDMRHFPDPEKDGRFKPKSDHKVKYISMRVTEADHDRIMHLFGDNSGVREFLVNYSREHEGEKT